MGVVWLKCGHIKASTVTKRLHATYVIMSCPVTTPCLVSVSVIIRFLPPRGESSSFPLFSPPRVILSAPFPELRLLASSHGATQLSLAANHAPNAPRPQHCRLLRFSSNLQRSICPICGAGQALYDCLSHIVSLGRARPLYAASSHKSR